MAHQLPAENRIPRPRLALNIGVTGHRLNKLSPETIVRVTEQFRRFADMTNGALDSIRHEVSGAFRDEAPLVRFVTGLAEGTDRIAITNAPASWTYEVILPMAREEYVKDFVDATSRTEFDAMLTSADSVTELVWPDPATPTEDRSAGYARLGDFLLRQIDVLIAVWDGESPAGAGGTGEVVAKARAAGKPVCWIRTGETTDLVLLDPTMPARSGENLTVLDGQKVMETLRTLLVPRSAIAIHAGWGHAHAPPAAHPPSPEAAMPLYFDMPWPRKLYFAFGYMVLRKLAKAGRWSWPLRYPDFKQQSGSWDDFFVGMPPASTKQDIASVLFPRSIWADTFAWYFGNVYRSAYVSIFIMASLSVPLGLCYLFFLSSPAVLDIKAGFVVAELLIITTVIVVVRRGVRQDWHGLWLQTRELSELLRLGRSLAYVGAARSFVPVPAAGEAESVGSWYARATFREIGLPGATLDSNYLKSVLKATRVTEIHEQRSYHAANVRNLHRVHHLLHKSGDFCFVATIVFLLIYLAAWGFDWVEIITHAHAEEAAHGETEHSLFHELLEYGIKPIVSIMAAGLPALGAALTGIREQGDFEGFAERSASTDEELAISEADIDRLLQAPAVNLAQATDALLQAVHTMAKDVTAWKTQYLGKRLSLPA